MQREREQNHFDREQGHNDFIKNSMAEEPTVAFRSDFVKELPNAQLFLVGGAIRDAILGKRNKDFDFVICGLSKERVEEWFHSRGRIDEKGRNFGVYKFLPEGHSPKTTEFVDIALPRSEHTAEGGMGGARDFDVEIDENLPIEKDLARRDFTINAMSFDVRESKIVDPFGGMQDLKQGVIKAVGDPKERFDEDMSRLLRAIRFSAQLDFDIESETWKALKQKMPDINNTRPHHKKSGEMEFVVPRETIGKELAKAIKRGPKKALKLMRDSGVFLLLLPQVHEAIQAEQDYLDPILSSEPDDLTITLALLLRNTPAKNVRKQLAEAGFTSLPTGVDVRVKEDDVAWIVDRLENTEADEKPDHIPASQFERIYMNPRGDRYLEVLITLGRTEVVKIIRKRQNEIQEKWQVEKNEKIPVLISGRDVISAGVQPGPKIRELLEQIRDRQLEGEILTREAALKLLKHLTK